MYHFTLIRLSYLYFPLTLFDCASGYLVFKWFWYWTSLRWWFIWSTLVAQHIGCELFIFLETLQFLVANCVRCDRSCSMVVAHNWSQEVCFWSVPRYSWFGPSWFLSSSFSCDFSLLSLRIKVLGSCPINSLQVFALDVSASWRRVGVWLLSFQFFLATSFHIYILYFISMAVISSS